MYQVPLKVYEELKQAAPEEKRYIVLSIIEEHPDHRLELPERDGLRADLSGVDLSREALQKLAAQRPGESLPWWGTAGEGANLEDADLRGANLGGANLQGASLPEANLQGATLWFAKLQGARLYEAKLQGAHLQYAELQGADLSGSKMRHCYLSGAWLDRTRLRLEQLGGAVGEERDGDYTEARIAYLGLKKNFRELGDYYAASWAYCRERRMEKREALKKARDAHARHDWKQELSCYRKVFFDQMVELVCDYGEGIGRVLVCLALLWLGSALFYGITGHVRSDSGLKHITRNVIDLLSFSLATMVTLEAPGLYVYPTWAIRVLMPLQAALGIFFLGLLGFVAGNRIRRS